MSPDTKPRSPGITTAILAQHVAEELASREPEKVEKPTPARKMLDAMLKQAARTVSCGDCHLHNVTLHRDGVDENGKTKYVCVPCKRKRTHVISGGVLAQ